MGILRLAGSPGPFEQRFEQRAREDLIRTSQRRAVDQTKICSENLRELARDQAR